MAEELEMDWATVGLEAREGQPPQVDPETMTEIEAAAGQEKISRLLEMGVMRNPTAHELEQGEILTTRSFRNGTWEEEMQICCQRVQG